MVTPPRTRRHKGQALAAVARPAALPPSRRSERRRDRDVVTAQFNPHSLNALRAA